MTRLFFSLVLYKHSIDDISLLLSSIRSLSCSQLFVDYSIHLLIYDNSPDSRVRSEIANFIGDSFHFHFKHSGKNIGFGRAHNKNIFDIQPIQNDIVLIVNPDISFLSDNLYPLINHVISLQGHCCVSPLIRLPNKSVQYTVKKNPTLLSLLIGRFFSVDTPLLGRYLFRHQNRSYDYFSDFIPSSYLSGCFLVLGREIFDSVSGFSSQYFLHLEDADFVRKCSLLCPTYHYPSSFVVHEWARGSHKSFIQNINVIVSAFLYFSTWGFRLW